MREITDTSVITQAEQQIQLGKNKCSTTEAAELYLVVNITAEKSSCQSISS